MEGVGGRGGGVGTRRLQIPVAQPPQSSEIKYSASTTLSAEGSDVPGGLFVAVDSRS